MNSTLKFKLLSGLARFIRTYQPRGAERLLRLLYHPDRRQTDHFEIVMPYDEHLFIQVNTSSFIEWSLFFYGHYEPHITRLLKRLFRPDFVAIDVGANIGCHALTMAALASAGTVIAIEPHPAIFQRLVKNSEINRLLNLRALPCALSDVRGESLLFSVAPEATNQGVSSLHAQNVAVQATPMTVTTRTLDDLLPELNLARLDFIKIDTEGHEYFVLQGARESLRRYRPYVLLEYGEQTWKNANASATAARQLFAELDYTLLVVRSDYLVKVDDFPNDYVMILATPNHLAV